MEERMQVIAGRFFVDEDHHPYEGELAQVLRTYDKKNQMRPVAIKLFREGSLDTRVVLEAFARECESLAKVSGHVNIVPLVDYGTDPGSGRKYIALEWAESNLLEHVRRQPVSEWDAFYERFGASILDALAFAFANDVMHRDVKPQNVLIAAAGVPQVADFGISKFKRYYRPGVTLAHFKSKPYAPEVESEQFADTRDVFGYGVLCLECLSDLDFDDYPDVYRALDEVKLPGEIREILSRAIQKQPADRQRNVAQLQDELTAAHQRRQDAARIRRTLPVSITSKASRIVMAEFGEMSPDEGAARLLRELNEICGIERLEDEEGTDTHVSLITAELRCRAVIEGAGLCIIGVGRGTPSSLAKKRERAWRPLVTFVAASPADKAGSLTWFEEGLDEFLSERKVEDARRAETELFDKWSALLRLKQSVENGRTQPLPYDGVRIDGLRVHLSTARASADIAGEDRVLRTGADGLVGGVIESVSADTVVLDCAPGQNLFGIPPRGMLEADTRQALTAIRRQNGALDALRFRRAARPELRELLLGGTAAGPPVAGPPLTFFQQDLDEDKKLAVEAALRAPDLMVVEGPPGTGKTKFVTELVAQTMKERPGAKILLSSQTHIALDHALGGVERLARESGLSLKAVRVARIGDPRVAQSVDHLLLERRVTDWLETAGEASKRFLLEWAKERGISEEYVRVGMALADLRAATLTSRSAEEELAAATAEMMDLAKKDRELREDPEAGDQYRDVHQSLQLATVVVDEKEEIRLEARRRLAAAKERARAYSDLKEEVDGLSVLDMEGLEAAYLAHAEGGDDYRRMMELADEWRQRFGRPADFFGVYLAACDLVAGTCLGVATSGLQETVFDLCIIDEASKASPTEILVPMVKARKWVIVGDPQQLPPFVEAGIKNSLLEQHGLTKDDVKSTLLDHLIAIAPDACRSSLLTQHRMVKPIGDLVSHCFYEGRLNNVNERVDSMLAKALALPKPVTWLTTSSKAGRYETQHRGSFVNRQEIDAVERLLGRLQLAASQRGQPYSVALLSGYGGQVIELGRRWEAIRHRHPDLEVESATVDSFQGREADIAVYSVARSNKEGQLGFLGEKERLNVALSRGRLGLAIVGDSLFCEKAGSASPFMPVIDHIRANPQDCAMMEA